MSFFLGIEVSRLSDGIILSQRKITNELLVDCGLDVSKTDKTPFLVSLKLMAKKGDFYHDPSHFRCLVGKLNFLTHTRSDISFAVQTLSHFLQALRVQHVSALHHLLRYIVGIVGQGILLQDFKHLTLQGYSDSYWEACPNSKRSVTGYFMLLGSSPLNKLYRAMAAAASEISRLVRLLNKLGVTDLTLVKLSCDNQSAIHLGKNPLQHEMTKHIELDVHFTRDKGLGWSSLMFLQDSSLLIF